MKPIILIPTYNEAETISSLLRSLEKIRGESEIFFDVVVIDDNSPDKTRIVVEELSLPWVATIKRSKKSGLGPAYREGFQFVTDIGKYTHIVTMDADGSHRPQDLLTLFKAVQPGKRVILGTRWMEGGSVVNWPRRRQLLSRIGTSYARICLGIPQRDLTGGFRIYDIEVVKDLNVASMSANGYCFQIEMALACHLSGASLIEVPITFVERVHGNSKMSPSIALEALQQTTIWGLRRALRRNADKLHYVK